MFQQSDRADGSTDRSTSLLVEGVIRSTIFLISKKKKTHHFAGASGLLTNLDKCLISPIRCSDDDILLVQQVFPCRLSPFPCRYLGAPLSLSRLPRLKEQRLVNAVASRIPTWKAGLLNTAGRLTLTSSTLSAIPVHISITCCLSKWALNQVDKCHRAFL